MKRFFQKILFWLYIKTHTIFIRVSIALYNTENEILKADPNISNEKDKKIQRKRHRNETLEKFYAGQRDEKFVQDYYELLTKADGFMRDATPHKMAVAADKHTKTYGQKDKYGRRYEHFGFFDEKHKHAGKTIGEVLTVEMMERRTMDDDYELLQIFNNKPIDIGLARIFDMTKNTGNKVTQPAIESFTKTEKAIIHNVFEWETADEKEIIDVVDRSKQFVFPLKVYRNNESSINKIEQLTEFLHIKKTAFEYRILEFFIPLKFKTSDFCETDDIFKELIDIKEVFINDEYGKLIGFGIVNYRKRIKHNDTYDVLKFDGIEMQIMGQHIKI